MCACVCCHTVQTNMSISIWNMLVWNKWSVNACMWIYTACMCWALCARIQTECSSAYSKEGDRGVGEGEWHIFTYVCTRGTAQNEKVKIINLNFIHFSHLNRFGATFEKPGHWQTGWEQVWNNPRHPTMRTSRNSPKLNGSDFAEFGAAVEFT